MWLLHSTTYEIHEHFEHAIPRYAVLSHMWGGNEVPFMECQALSPEERGRIEKIRRCCLQAVKDGIQWVWIDTCCIVRSHSGVYEDKKNNVELSEIINSIYAWLENSEVCYAYLDDVSNFASETRRTLRTCKWFTRKWTLQELVAPTSVRFYAKNWVEIGTRSSLHDIIAEITGIPSSVLKGEKTAKQCHVSERIAWAANREATEVEDKAYSLLGLLDIKLPIKYGEGSRAFRRLQDKVRETHYPSILDAPSTGMRLLVTNSATLEIKKFTANDTPEYAILSHTWGHPDDEVSFWDVCNGEAEKKKLGFQKIKKCCQLAAEHGFEYLWVDTCCIDKDSSAELQEAICSMYRWYKLAQICYVYLKDYNTLSEDSSFWRCAWFTRGWTLQELIAPTYVEFYDENWTEIGSKFSLCEEISEVTSIDPDVLLGYDPTKCTVAQRMSWAASRSTTRIEDIAYSLMGLFNVFMPMLYGEGSRAFTRLQEEIMKQTEDYTIFAWRASYLDGSHRGILAHSPDEFLEYANVVSRYNEEYHEHEHPPALNSRGLLIDMPLLLQPSFDNTYLAWVCCLEPANDGTASEEKTLLCIWLKELPPKARTSEARTPASRKFGRIFPGKLERLPATCDILFMRRTIYLLPFGIADSSESSAATKPRSGKIRVDVSDGFTVEFEPIPVKIFRSRGFNFNVEWRPHLHELLYSYHASAETGTLAMFRVKLTDEGGEEQFHILLGVRNHLPWCSIVTSGELAKMAIELGFPINHQWNQTELIEHLYDITRLTKSHQNYTDRSTKLLLNQSTITAVLRIACSPPLNPPVSRLQLRYIRTITNTGFKV